MKCRRYGVSVFLRSASHYPRRGRPNAQRLSDRAPIGPKIFLFRHFARLASLVAEDAVGIDGPVIATKIDVNVGEGEDRWSFARPVEFFVLGRRGTDSRGDVLGDDEEAANEKSNSAESKYNCSRYIV